MAGSPITGDPLASPFGGDTSMLINLITQMMAGQLGGYAGQFTPTMSFADNLRQQEQARQAQAAMQGVAQTEAANARRIGVGLMHIGGFNPNDPTNVEYLNTVQGHYASTVPYLASIFGRDFVSAIGGRQGSAALGAEDIRQAGQFGYDPVTGNYGMSGKSAAAVTNGAVKALYGPDADPALMRGIRFDQATDFYKTMKYTRGDGPATARSILNDEDMKRIETAAWGEDNFDIRKVLGDKAKKFSDTELQILTDNRLGPSDGATKVDTARMTEYMKTNVGMMRALKDVFGPNTPWAEAMQLAKDLTQNNAQSLDRNEMETFLRTSKELATSSGMGMQGMMNLSGFLGQYANQMGMSRRGVGNAVQAGAAAQEAFMAGGLGNIDRLNMQEHVAKSAQLTLQAGNSQAAMQIGAGLNLDKSMGGFKEGTKAAQYIEAIRNGQPTFAGGQSVVMSESEFRDMMIAGGADPALVRAARNRSAQNTKTAIDAGADDIVRQMQFERDIKPRIAAGLGDVYSQAGFKGKNGHRAANNAIDAIMSMDHEMYANDADGRTKAIMEAIRNSPGGAGMSEKQLRQLASAAYDDFENSASVRGWGNGSKVKAYFDPNQLREQRRARGRSKEMGDFTRLMSGTADDSFMSRLVQATMSADADTSPDDLLKAAFNIQDRDKIKEAAAPHLKRLEEERAAYDKILKDDKYYDADKQKLTEEGMQYKKDHKAQVDSILGDMTKSIDEAVAGASGTKVGPGKSSDKDPAGSDLADGGRKTLTIAGRIEWGGVEVPITGEAYV